MMASAPEASDTPDNIAAPSFSPPSDTPDNIVAPSPPVEAAGEASVPDWYSLDDSKAPPPPVAEEASVGDTVPSNPVVDEGQETPDDGTEGEVETVARRSRKRRGRANHEA